MKKLTTIAPALALACPALITLPQAASAQDGEQQSAATTTVENKEAATGGDYNSSRSNRGASVAADGGDGVGDDVGNGATRATDYNSSRSNKSFAAPADLGDGDGEPEIGSATDYNSSRSNKADSGAVASEDELIAVDGDTTKTGRNPQTGKEIKSPN